MKDTQTHFAHLVNLADKALGAAALGTNDDFFAGIENLLEPGRGSFDPDAYGERGKIMDGWESRRKRGPGHDWCIVRLGCPGRVRLLDIDTNHFLGNHPPFASVDGVRADADASLAELTAATWSPVLPQAPLRPGSQNVFAPAAGDTAWTHLRLNIHPDGGVARLRAYGDVEPGWDRGRLDDEARAHVGADDQDLAGVVNGGLALACSDSFFGPMNNLLLPERAPNMGGGWETRRRRGPGFDWILVRLGASGVVHGLELDTNHFKGNFPDSASVEGILASDGTDVTITDLIDPAASWATILPRTELQAHHRHFYGTDRLESSGPFSHVRLTIHPDGGVSRLRVFGRPEGR
jgi:allantoicase